MLLEPHPVIVEPVADAPRLKVQLLTEEIHGCGAGVRLQGEGDVQRFLLLVTKENPLLFGGSGAVDLVGVHVGGVGRGGPVRARVHASFSLRQVIVFSLVLQGLQFLNVVRVVQPELHPDEGFTALDAEHVPRLRLGQELADGSLRQAQDGFTEELEKE